MHQFGTKVFPESIEVDIVKRNSEFVFPCRTGEILQERQPVSTAVYKAEGDLWQEFEETHSKEKKQPEMLEFDKIFDALWRSHMTEGCCSENETRCSEGCKSGETTQNVFKHNG